jgi:hypothetical protein
VKTNRLWMRAARLAAAAGLGVWLAASALPCLAAVAGKAKAKEPPAPSYVIPNIAAIGMFITVLAIPCKRYPRG